MPQLISIGQIIDQTWERYKKNFSEFTNLSIWLLVPCLISIVSVTFYPPATTLLAERAMSSPEIVSVIIWVANSFLVAPIIGLWIFLTTVRLLSYQEQGKKINLKTISQEAWKLFLPVIFLNIIVSLVLLVVWLLMAPGLAINWLGVNFDLSIISIIGAVLTFVGLLLAAILDLRWLVHFTFSPFLLITENLHGTKALLRSSELVRGKFFPVLIRLLVPVLVFVFFFFIAELVLGFISEFLITAVAGLNADLMFRLGSISTTLLVCLGSIFLTPVLIIANFFLFDSLKKTTR